MTPANERIPGFLPVELVDCPAAVWSTGVDGLADDPPARAPLPIPREAMRDPNSVQ